jgi:hypothetical protein
MPDSDEAKRPAAPAASSGESPLSVLLEAVEHFISRYVVLSPTQRGAIALWVAHTHAIEAAFTTPYLSITSAEKSSGKTRLLEVAVTLVARPWFTGRVSPAALVRKVDSETPTLLLDESDAAFNGDKEYAEALRGVLNTGYRRGGKATVCVGQGANIHARDFSTFGPKAIAGVGRLPDTVADRSISIRLKKRAPWEAIERYRERRVREAGGRAFRRARSLDRRRGHGRSAAGRGAGVAGSARRPGTGRLGAVVCDRRQRRRSMARESAERGARAVRAR